MSTKRQRRANKFVAVFAEGGQSHKEPKALVLLGFALRLEFDSKNKLRVGAGSAH